MEYWSKKNVFELVIISAGQYYLRIFVFFTCIDIGQFFFYFFFSGMIYRQLNFFSFFKLDLYTFIYTFTLIHLLSSLCNFYDLN